VPTWSPLLRLSCFDLLEVLLFDGVLLFEDELGREVVVLCLGEVLALAEDALGLEDVLADLADAIGLAVPPEVNDDEGFCLALVPRLAEDIAMIRVRKCIECFL